MTRPWFAVDADAPRNEKLADMPSDTIRWGWIVMLGEAKLLRKQGTFSAGQWAQTMGRYGRHLETYISSGLIHRAPNYCDDTGDCLRGRGPFKDGTLVIHDWPTHQREHAVRTERWRGKGDAESDAIGDSLSDVSSDVASDIHSRALSLSPVDINPKLRENPGREGVGERGDVGRLQQLAEDLTQQAYVMADVYGGYGLKAVSELLPHGYEAVERAWREVAARHPKKVTLRQLVFESGDLLNPIARTAPPREKSREEVVAEIEAMAAGKSS